MLSSCYMWGELISVMASVATHVALKRITESMASHMNGKHHIIQKEDTAVVTSVDPNGFTFLIDDLKGITWAYSWWLDDVIWPWELLQGLETIAGLGRYHLVLVVGMILALLMVAVSVCGILTTVVWGKTSVRRQTFVPQVGMALFCILWVAIWHFRAGEWYWIQAVDDRDHFRSGSWWGLHKRTQCFCPKVSDGIIYGLVHHTSLHHLSFLFIHVTWTVINIKAMSLFTYKRKKKLNLLSEFCLHILGYFSI